jgi:Ni/Co efflux regulator RcnB
MKKIVSLVLALIVLAACFGCVAYERDRDRPYDRDRYYDGNREGDRDRSHDRDRSGDRNYGPGPDRDRDRDRSTDFGKPKY